VRVAVPLDVSEALAAQAIVAPNPFQNHITVTLPDGMLPGCTFELSDLTGRRVGQWLLRDGVTPIMLPELSQGTYVYRLLLGRQLIQSGVVVRQ
jgi:hypothetical protein